MKKIFFVMSLALSFTSHSWAVIKESNNIEEVLNHVTPQTLVLFDIDNTIIQPKQSLGSDQWYSNLVKTFKRTMPEEEAKTKAISIWQKVQGKIEVMPVEPDTIEVIKKLQKDNVRVMALTARSKPVVDRTIELLSGLGIDFSANNLELSKAKLYEKNDVKIKNGIIFIGPLNNKGKVLLQFLAKTKLKPQKIVFIDDKSEHTQSVDAALNSVGIDHIAIRYGGADRAVASFSRLVAEKQLDVFNLCGKFVSDQLAKKNLKTRLSCDKV